jgi:hypothetical protein
MSYITLFDRISRPDVRSTGRSTPIGQIIGEIGLRGAAERAIGNAEVPPAKRIVDHLAHLHDPPWIGPRLAVHDDAEDDVVILEPCRLLRVSTSGLSAAGMQLQGSSVVS